MNDLKQNHLHHFLREKEMIIAPFNKRSEAFKGYQLDVQRAFEKVDPQILLSLDPVPITKATKYFLKKMRRAEARDVEVPAVQQPTKAASFFDRFK